MNSTNIALKELKQKYSESKSALDLNETNNSYCLELKSTLNEYVEELLPSELRTSELRTLATIAIKKKILQSDLIILRGSGAYDHIRSLLINASKKMEGPIGYLYLKSFFKLLLLAMTIYLM